MIPYFIIFLIPAFLAINNKLSNSNFIWLFTGGLFSLLIGLRDHVGGDWGTYFNHYLDSNFKTYSEILTNQDPGYYLINLFMYDLDLGIYGVNFVCAAIFMYGLIKFAKQEYNPWMIIAVAVPYTITVVAMGYTRQAVALGLVMWAITYLKENRMIGFFLFIILAASFHKSAVLMIGLGIFANGGGKFLKIIAIGAIGIGLYNTFLASHADALVKSYINSQMQSSGAFIRTFMNLTPAILLILYRKRWKEFFDDFTFWFIIAILSIISFTIVGVASTAVDRMALYLLPIQMIVFARLGILMSHQFSLQTINIAIIAYYTLVLFVWLNFAAHAHYWVPYQNIIFLNLW